MEVIELEVDADTAQRFRELGDGDRAWLGGQMAWLVNEPPDKGAAGERLRRTIDEVGASATVKGLTPEILDDLLRDD